MIQTSELSLSHVEKLLISTYFPDLMASPKVWLSSNSQEDLPLTKLFK